MIAERVRRWILFLGSVVLLTASVFLLTAREYTQCLGLPLRKTEPATPYEYTDYSQELFFMGQLAPIDVESSTIYIPQVLEEDTQPFHLTGKLTLKKGLQKLYFVEDAAFADLKTAAAENHPFSLVIEGKGSHMRYNVLFTTLPVLCMDQPDRLEPQSKGEGEEVYGVIRVWNPDDRDAGGYTVTVSDLQWKLRGNYTQGRPKKNWKLTLLKKNGGPKNEKLVGLGQDDDWLLNGMFLDDTKMKEKLLMTLWNQLAQQTPWDESMSTGSYAEVLINGNYRGIYLTQRRVDGKYLSLKKDQILIKAYGGFDPTTEDTFKVVYSPYSTEKTLELWMDLVLNDRLNQRIDVRNYIDVSLFMQFGALTDNVVYRNVFYLLTPDGDDYSVSLILWDTDQAMGVGPGFKFDLDASVRSDVTRMEYDAIYTAIPDFRELLRTRWRTLRQGVLSLENVEVLLTELETQLCAGGSLTRDVARWGQAYGGQESIDTLRQYFTQRLAYLDDYYGV